MNAKPCLAINDLNADLVSSDFGENLVNQIFADLWDSIKKGANYFWSP